MSYLFQTSAITFVIKGNLAAVEVMQIQSMVSFSVH